MRSLLIATLFIAACSRDAVETRETPGTLTITDTSVTTTGVTGGTVSAAKPVEKEFVVKAIETGMGEIALGQMASAKASTQTVKDYAARMIADHTRMNEVLKRTALVKGLAIPTALNEEHDEATKRLNALTGLEFDRAYLSQMIVDHEKAARDFEAALQTTEDAELRVFLFTSVAMLRDHRNAAEERLNALRP